LFIVETLFFIYQGNNFIFQNVERCKNCGSGLVSELARTLKPRYDLSTKNVININ